NLNEPKTPELNVSVSLESRVLRLESELMKLQEIVKQLNKGSGETPGESKIVKYLQDEQNRLEQDYQKIQIISDTDDIGKLITIAEALKTIKSFEIDVLRLGRKVIPEHRVIKTHTQSLAIGFLQINGTPFTTRIKNYNELVISHKDIRFILLRDCRQPVIKGGVGKQEIEKLQNTVNGDFILINKEDRIRFELIYKLITDIQNKDFEMELERALNILIAKLSDYWLIQIFSQ
ncbi:MAG TPA: exonuclease, partial [Cyanophyceae cyanobacterium]